MWFTTKSKEDKQKDSEETEKFLTEIDNLENQLTAKNIQIQILTNRHNSQSASIFGLKSKISELTERLKLYEEVSQEKETLKQQRKSSAPTLPNIFTYQQKSEVLPNVLSADARKKIFLKQIDSLKNENQDFNPSKNSQSGSLNKSDSLKPKNSFIHSNTLQYPNFALKFFE
jgi:hypothetical protein